ncbi:MAG: iron ABC transporter permease [Endomicrobium sp.]|nr:iron ABC transporter permease [Endomicrobium sp.]
MIVLLIVVFFASLMYGGTKKISIINVLNVLFCCNKNINNEDIMIIKYIRLQRTIVSYVVGAGLSVSGLIFQAILKNPMADPFTLGISGGAALGVAVAFIFGLSSIASIFIPLCSFVGMIISIFTVYFTGIKKCFSSKTMILSGVVVNYIFSSVVILLFALSPSKDINFAFMWLIGDFFNFDEKLFFFSIIVIFVCIILLFLFANIINIMYLDNERLKIFGVNIKKNIMFLFFVASIITAATVSICGIISFVGLIVPHFVRMIIDTNDNVLVVPLSAFSGALFLSFCDVLNRMIFSRILIPIGVIINIVGGFFFICLLLNQKKNINIY